jgi:hypothetical protein
MRTLDTQGIEANILVLRTQQSVLEAAKGCPEHGREHLAICPECEAVYCIECRGGDATCYCDVDPDWERE